MLTQSKLGKILFSLSLFSYGVFAASLKVGTVDMQKAMFETKKGRAAKVQIEKEGDDRKKKVTDGEANLRKLGEEFQKKAMVMSDKAKMEKQMELQKKMEDLQRLAQESEIDHQKRINELFRPIADSMRDVVSDVAKKKGLDMVFEVSNNELIVQPGSNLIYAAEKQDLTQDAIKAYDEKFK